jgi:hypothetical protein
MTALLKCSIYIHYQADKIIEKAFTVVNEIADSSAAPAPAAIHCSCGCFQRLAITIFLVH